jgi:hypothetical protein
LTWWRTLRKFRVSIVFYPESATMPNARVRTLLAAITLAMAAGCGSDDPASPPPTEFTIAIENNPTVVAPGTTKATFVRITRVNGFANSIQFTVSNIPGPISVGLGSMTAPNDLPVDIGVAAGAPLGNYSFTLTAAALGAATQELVVTVTAAVFGSAQGFLK